MDAATLLPLLREALNDPTADFRPGQVEAVVAALTPPYRALVVQATGWGKSMVYFLATKVLRDQGKGPTLVISPLLSLMRDQLIAAERLGLSAAKYTSDNEDDWPAVQAALKKGTTDLLLISPERLASDSFREFIASSSLAKVGLIVIDEAHCISDWGHDFRPDYQRLGELVRKLPATTSILATTATANSRVMADVAAQIGPNIRTLRGPLARKSLKLQVFAGLDAAERLAWLDDHLNDLPGSGIIYALTIRDADRVTAWLTSRGHNVLAYHSQLDKQGNAQAVRAAREEMLRGNHVKALVSTVALGMGFDKPDLGFVVHYQSPGNLVAYYQQIGRAGRAIPEAITVLFMGNEDADIHKWFVDNAKPPEEDIRAVLTALEAQSLSVPSLTNALNMPKGKIEAVLKTLGVLSNSPVVKLGSKWQRTPIVYRHDPEREAELKQRRTQERRRFEEFAATGECLMMIVQKELDDQTAEPCGRCANCMNAEIVSSELSDASVRAALLFLRRSETIISPRLAWPPGKGMPEYRFTGRIPEGIRCSPGLCLAQWGDPGIASWVREDKQAGHFRDDLVSAAVEAINRSAIPPVHWVCAVPSLRSQTTVPDFAKRLATALNLPYVEAVVKVRETGPQKDQRNSFHQAANLDGAFAVKNVLHGTALLVDDMVDSRWTFTIIGALLRSGGVEAVVPLALASTKSRGETDE